MFFLVNGVILVFEDLDAIPWTIASWIPRSTSQWRSDCKILLKGNGYHQKWWDFTGFSQSKMVI
jgi:hypothetical protein